MSVFLKLSLQDLIISLRRGCMRVQQVLVKLMLFCSTGGCMLSRVQVQVLDAAADRASFVRNCLRGKNILHVKGFGRGFKAPTPSQAGLEAKQQQEVVKALEEFSPDYVVVDGDPFGSGFPRYIKAFVDLKRRRGDTPPHLIWARNVAMAPSRGGTPSNPGERSRRVQQAKEWAAQLAVPVTVFWVDVAKVDAAMDSLFGQGTSAALEPAKFSARGIVKVSSSDSMPFVSGLPPALRASIAEVEDPEREGQRFFEKCSFENSAKGNVIYDELDAPGIAAHGVVCAGGGESVLLELATKYMNPKSGFNAASIAVFPHSRGRADCDPKLPLLLGSAFGGDACTL